MAFKWLKRKKDKDQNESSEGHPDAADEIDGPSEAVDTLLPDSSPGDESVEREDEPPPIGDATPPPPKKTFSWSRGHQDAAREEEAEVPTAAEADEDAEPLEAAFEHPVADPAPTGDKEDALVDMESAEADSDEGAEPDKPRRGFFKRLRSGLSKTRDFLNTDIEDLFSGKRKFDDEMLEELEELLITADIGVRTAMDLIDKISRKASKIDSVDGLKAILRDEILKLIDEAPTEEACRDRPPGGHGGGRQRRGQDHYDR